MRSSCSSFVFLSSLVLSSLWSSAHFSCKSLLLSCISPSCLVRSSTWALFRSAVSLSCNCDSSSLIRLFRSLTTAEFGCYSLGTGVSGLMPFFNSSSSHSYSEQRSRNSMTFLRSLKMSCVFLWKPSLAQGQATNVQLRLSANNCSLVCSFCCSRITWCRSFRFSSIWRFSCTFELIAP